MGSLCTSGPAKTTSTSTTTPTGLAQLNDIYSRVSSAASTPYQPYTGQLVAGLDPNQTAGINSVTNAVGSATPYFDLAAQYGQQGAASINPDDVSKYMNPYTQSVINSTQANFNEGNQQQQQQVIGNAAKVGALGGDRTGVAQAELARQQKLAQDPVIAGLQSQNYSQALGAAQQDRSAAAQGAYTFGSLAPAIQNTAIAGGNAQIGAGSVAQNNQQQNLSAQYQQFLNAQAFPYQQASFLAQYGLPTAAAMGTTTGTASTQQAGTPSILQSILGGAGVGLAAYDAFGGSGGSGSQGSNGLSTDVAGNGSGTYTGNAAYPGFAARGGRIEMRRGGRVGMNRGGRAMRRPAFADGGFIDQVHAIRQALRGGGVVSAPSNPYAMPGYAEGGQVDENYVDGSLPWANIFSNVPTLSAPHVAPPAPAPTPAAPAPSQSQSGGGMGDMAGMAMKLLPLLLNRGGRVGYADGGDVNFGDRFGDDQFSPYALDPTQLKDSFFAQNGADPAAFRGDRAPPIAGPIPMPPARPAGLNGGVSAPPAMPPSQIANSSPYALPPQITDPDGTGGGPGLPPDAMAYNGAGSPQAPPAMGGPPLQPSRGADSPAAMARGALGLSDDARMALLSASLGILGSKASTAMGALGEGGEQGIKTYTEAKNSRQKNELEARRLIQQAEQFSQTLGVHKDQLSETQKQHAFEREKYEVPIGFRRGPDGKLESVPGGPHDPATIEAETKAKRVSGMSEMAEEVGARQIAKGDLSSLTNYGRGAQGPDNINRLRNRATQILVDEEGMTPAAAAAHMSERMQAFKAEGMGRGAAARSIATQEAKMGTAGFEAKGAIQLGRKIIEKVPRTSFLPFNQLIEMYQKKTLSPDQAELFTRTQGIINTYAAVMARGANVTTDASRHRAEELLQTASNPDVYNRVLDTMESEIDMALNSPDQMRKFYEKKYGDRSVTPESTTSAPPAKSIPSGAVDKLKANPGLAPAFDAQFGTGAASRVLGR